MYKVNYNSNVKLLDIENLLWKVEIIKKWKLIVENEVLKLY